MEPVHFNGGSTNNFADLGVRASLENRPKNFLNLYSNITENMPRILPVKYNFPSDTVKSSWIRTRITEKIIDMFKYILVVVFAYAYIDIHFCYEYRSLGLYKADTVASVCYKY